MHLHICENESLRGCHSGRQTGWITESCVCVGLRNHTLLWALGSPADSSPGEQQPWRLLFSLSLWLRSQAGCREGLGSLLGSFSPDLIKKLTLTSLIALVNPVMIMTS